MVYKYADNHLKSITEWGGWREIQGKTKGKEEGQCDSRHMWKQHLALRTMKYTDVLVLEVWWTKKSHNIWLIVLYCGLAIKVKQPILIIFHLKKKKCMKRTRVVSATEITYRNMRKSQMISDAGTDKEKLYL